MSEPEFAADLKRIESKTRELLSKMAGIQTFLKAASWEPSVR